MMEPGQSDTRSGAIPGVAAAEPRSGVRKHPGRSAGAALSFALALFAALAAAGCSPDGGSGGGEGGGAAGPRRVSVQLDWFPESQHGGLYQAAAKGYFAAEGLEVSLDSGGGANLFVNQHVGDGRSEFGQVASSGVIIGTARGLPIKMVASVFHDAPSVLMLHADNPISTFPELDGKRVMGRSEALYIPYLKKRYGIDFEVLQQTKGLGHFLADKNFIQEGFYISEFYLIEREGVVPKPLHLRDSGYINALVLVVNGDFLRANPEVVSGFVNAYRRGWEDYLTGDPAPAHEALLEANAEAGREVDLGFLEFSRKLIIRDGLAAGKPGWGEAVGNLAPRRYREQIEQLVELGVIGAGEVQVADLIAEGYAAPEPAPR